ncbi:MAG: metal-sensitive transcriptional regulator [Betaproteobacteria bacterium]|nr:metal-sensitive transcriptional regulator [Betaproteobacteria bacterium]
MSRPQMHDPEAKQAMLARLARIEGQVRAVRRMVDTDKECEEIAQQLSAARKALDRAFYEMVACLIKAGGAERRVEREASAGHVAELLARYA